MCNERKPHMASPIRSSDPEFSLSDTFDAFATRSVVDFQQLDGRFVIYNSPADTLHGNFPDTQILHLLTLQQEKVTEFRRNYTTKPSAFSTIEEGYYFIDWIETDIDRRNYRTKNDPLEREINAYMAHELGHLVAPGALGRSKHNGNFLESIAEAFSFLRQQQEYGSIVDQLSVATHGAAARLALSRDTSHYNLPVLEELRRISDTYDLAALSMTPTQTANMAYRLALLYAPTSPDLRKLEEIFKPTMEAHLNSNESWNMQVYEACAAAMFEDHGEYSGKAFAAGKAFIGPLLDGRADILSHNITEEDLQKFSGSYWDSIRDKIKEHSQKEETLTPEQRFKREARDMMVFGYFDKSQDEIIKPGPYEADRNMAYLQRAQDAYVAIRCLQETGEQMPDRNDGLISAQEAANLSKDRIIALARRIGEEPSMTKAAPIVPSLR